jgi:hypothetical protein
VIGKRGNGSVVDRCNNVPRPESRDIGGAAGENIRDHNSISLAQAETFASADVTVCT